MSVNASLSTRLRCVHSLNGCFVAMQSLQTSIRPLASAVYSPSLLRTLVLLISTGESYTFVAVSLMLLLLASDAALADVIGYTANATKQNQANSASNVPSSSSTSVLSTLVSLLNSTVEYECRARIVAFMSAVACGSPKGCKTIADTRGAARGCIKIMKEGINYNKGDTTASDVTDGEQNARTAADVFLLEDGMLILQACSHSAKGVESLRTVLKDDSSIEVVEQAVSETVHNK